MVDFAAPFVWPSTTNKQKIEISPLLTESKILADNHHFWKEL
jgi:hypothetical protein